MKSHRKKSGTKEGAIPKTEIVLLVERLADRGLGANTIAELTGYHPSSIKHYLRMLGIPQMTQSRRVERIKAHLPEELLEQAASVKMRSELLDATYKGLAGSLDDLMMLRPSSAIADDTSAARPIACGV